MTEDWGGEIGCVKVSAMTGDGIDELLERILLESEMLELRANPERLCEGIVIEAQLESGMGPTANVLVRNGSLRVGDPILCGAYYGRIKALLDHRGKRIKIAGPSTPVKVLGLSGVPEAGDKILGVEDEKDARRLAEERAQEERQDDLAVSRKANLEDLFRQMAEEERDELKIIVKGDVRGSVEAIIESLLKIPSEKIRLNFIHTGVGEITENDVLLAAASDAVVVGFHVRAMPGINRVAKQEGVEIRLYSIIYELLTDIEEAMRGRLAPEKREIALGKAEILQIFRTSSSGKICGCMVQEGLIRVKANARVKREGEIIYNGQVVSLRRFQDDVREVRAGMECGIRLDNFEDFEVGDEIDVSMSEEFKAEL
jgi:translation initiation factor IF-2